MKKFIHICFFCFILISSLSGQTKYLIYFNEKEITPESFNEADQTKFYQQLSPSLQKKIVADTGYKFTFYD